VKITNQYKKFISVEFLTNNIVVGGANDDTSSDLFLWNNLNEKTIKIIPLLRPNELSYDANSKKLAIADYQSVLLLNLEQYITGVKNNALSDSKNTPNPFMNQTEIKINIPKSNNYKIEIYNTVSKLIEQIHNDYLEQGEHKFLWNSANYPTGTYFCRITGKDYSVTLKILLQR
jgi:hypothetical protein